MMEKNEEKQSSPDLRIIQGDCCEALKNFPENYVHLVVTSPPYNVAKDYGTYQDNLTEKEYLSFVESWLKECLRVLVSGGRICVDIPIYNFKQRFNMLMHYYQIMMKAGFQDRDIIIWVKLEGLDFAHSGKIFGKVSPKNPHTKYPCEIILVMQKEGAELKGEKSDLTYGEFYKWSNTIWFITPEYNRIHPAPFPEEIPWRLIKMFSFVGQRVLDPFLGSGTTMRVSKRLKRDCIGIELNPHYVEMAKKRVSYGKK